MNRQTSSGDLDAGVVDDRIAEARERIGRIGRSAGAASGRRDFENPVRDRSETNQETIMDDERKEGAAQQVRAAVKDILGLPPGDATPHGQGRPERDADAPHGSLTADDAEGLRLPGSTTDNSREAT
jgi:hypothetical protein